MIDSRSVESLWCAWSIDCQREFFCYRNRESWLVHESLSMYLRWGDWDETIITFSDCLRWLDCDRAVSILVHYCVVTCCLRTIPFLVRVLLLLNKIRLSGTLRFGDLSVNSSLGGLYFRRRVRPSTSFIDLACAWQTSSIIQHVLLLQLC